MRADGDVVRDRTFASHDAKVAELRRAGERTLRADENSAAYERIVANLDQVVNFGLVADARVAPAAAVDARARADLHLVAEEHAQQLRLLAHAARCWVDFEPKAVGANAHAAVQHAIRANLAILYGGVWPKQRAFAYNAASADDAARLQLAPCADEGAGEHHGSGSDRSAGVHKSTRVNKGDLKPIDGEAAAKTS